MSEIEMEKTGTQEMTEESFFITSEHKLTACPFCGNPEIYYLIKRTIYWNGEWVVRCDDCNARGAGGTTPEEAVELWNTRGLEGGGRNE